MKRNRAYHLRNIITGAMQSVDDETALDNKRLFPFWESGVSYETGTRVYYNENLYKVLQNHTSQDDWTPDNAVSLFALVLIPSEEIPEWVQPDSTNGYMEGDKVRHNEKIWISDVDFNVWEPGVYGWSEYE